MNIHQLSVSYDAEQDRMLLRFNTLAGEEMRLWLTRRLMLGLWPVLGTQAAEHPLHGDAPWPDPADPQLRRMLAEFRKDEFVQQADFATPYQAQTTLPLGADPLLVTRVDVTPLAGGSLRLNFHEQLPPAQAPGRSLQVEVASRLLHGLVHLLGQSLAPSRWREPLEARSDGPGAAASEGESPPARYLN